MPRSFILPVCLLSCATIPPGVRGHRSRRVAERVRRCLHHLSVCEEPRARRWHHLESRADADEGYTNFLLLIFLAPWIKAGVDPLLVTRIVSYASLCGIVAVLFRLSRQRFGQRLDRRAHREHRPDGARHEAPGPRPGWKPSFYVFFLLLTFTRGIDLIERQTVAAAIAFSVLLFVTMLLRPEAVLLYPISSPPFSRRLP